MEQKNSEVISTSEEIRGKVPCPAFTWMKYQRRATEEACGIAFVAEATHGLFCSTWLMNP